MEVLIENKVVIKREPVEMIEKRKGRRRSGDGAGDNMEPCEEFPILYGLLTAPKSFKPRNSEEMQIMEMEGESDKNSEMDRGRLMRLTSRVKLLRRRRSAEDESEGETSQSRSRSSSSESPWMVDSSNLSGGEDESISDDETRSSSGSSGSSCWGDSTDDNIPTSTTSGFKNKCSRLETAIGNIVKRKVRVQKRSSVPISLAPSSPTVSTTCVESSTPPRGRSEILERILRNNTSPNRQNDDNNNEAVYDGPYAKLRDLLTMPEDQMVKRRRLEYGLNENAKVEEVRADSRRDFSPPKNNILASLLQKGRSPFEPTSSSQGTPARQVQNGGRLSGNRLNVVINMNDERPYKCSLCDLRFKKLPLLNRHVKTHSHIKRYVCRFCSHAFKRSDNLLAHIRTSCKGVKEQDTQFAGRRVSQPASLPRSNQGGQIINQLLSSPPSGGSGPVSRSQLEEALLNLRAEPQERRYSAPLSPLVSTTTVTPPSVSPAGRHSKLLEILSGSPVARYPVVGVSDDEDDEQDMPLSLKVSRASSPACSPSSSSQFRRSHPSALYRNELPAEDDVEEEEEYLNDDEPLNLGRHLVASPPPPPAVPSAKSRDHPEIVSILSRQPKNNVVMLAAADLRKLVGLDSL